MARERTIGELSEDVEWLIKRMQRLDDRISKAPFVRADLHNEQIANIRGRLDGLHTMLMWILGILATMLVSGVVIVISAVARGGLG